MKYGVILLIVLMSGVLCVPGIGFTRMAAMTDAEMNCLTGQKGVITMQADVFGAMSMAVVPSPAWYGSDDLHPLFASGWLPFDTTVRADYVLAGENAEPFAMQSLFMAIGAAGLVNPFMGGLFAMGTVPGAFDVSMGDSSIEASGTITFSIHP